jgi:hypothetical protein
VADRLMVNEGGYEVQKQARVKTRRTRKRKCKKQENIQDELAQRDRKTGINTPGKISDTWTGWRQSQEQVKQIRA